MLRLELFLAWEHLRLRTQLPPWWLNSLCSRMPHNSTFLTLPTLLHLDKLALRSIQCWASVCLKQLAFAMMPRTPSTLYTTPPTTKGTLRVLSHCQAFIFTKINSTLLMRVTGIFSSCWLNITPSRSPTLSTAPTLLLQHSCLTRFKHQSTITIHWLMAISAMGKSWQDALSPTWLTTNGWEVPCSLIL